MSNENTDKHLSPYPPKDLLERIITDEMCKVYKNINPNIPEDVVRSVIKTFIADAGVDGYHVGFGGFIVKNLVESAANAQTMTFQELTEVLSLLPGRAPKELEVKFSRNEEGRLKMRFEGEIDVATTAGKRQE